MKVKVELTIKIKSGSFTPLKKTLIVDKQDKPYKTEEYAKLEWLSEYINRDRPEGSRIALVSVKQGMELTNNSLSIKARII